ncbi:MAG: hypothetical protein L0220_07945 [Acidobacteria bacterium]|nr:hypothetical protein [Acidobacteriota bacterium]
MRRFPLAVCSILLLSLVVSGLWATRATKTQLTEQYREATNPTNVTGLTMGEMAQGAERIVTGQCLGTRSTWVGRTLYTIATVQVSETIKGEPEATLNVLLPGGIDANRKIPVGMNFPGAPLMQRGEESFLFLIPADAMPGSYSVMGYAQGKLSIVANQDGEKMVSANSARVPMNSATGVVRGNAQMTRLSEFRDRVKAYLQ